VYPGKYAKPKENEGKRGEEGSKGGARQMHLTRSHQLRRGSSKHFHLAARSIETQGFEQRGKRRRPGLGNDTPRPCRNKSRATKRHHTGGTNVHPNPPKSGEKKREGEAESQKQTASCRVHAAPEDSKGK
jgi:hypothetical protein